MTIRLSATMKSRLRGHVAALLLLPAAVAVSAVPAAVHAQTSSPEIRSLQVNSDNGINPGSRLRFTLHGSPKGRANIRIQGVREAIPLKETSRGVYTGRHVIARADRIDENDKIRATLSRGNKTITASYDIPPGLGNVALARSALKIDRFAVTTQDRIEPGAELRMVVEGVPGATVSVDLPGLPNPLRLREVRPGHYEAKYTIRRADRLDVSGPVLATMRSGERVVTSSLAQPLGGPDTRAPVITSLAPREGEMVAAGAVVVSASFDDHGGSGVDPQTVRVLLSGRDVTPGAQVSAQSFSYGGALPPGRHTVDVTARDRAGNAMRRSWTFDVASGPSTVPLQILSHSNNGQVEGSLTHVRGRTAPFASVNVNVQALPPAGPQVQVARQLFLQTVQADANGNFDFRFASPFAMPGTRYDIAMVASKADVRTEARLVLFQGQG
ncbi:MAG TPA: hypothetical protein VK996_10805 [Ramlibacter sp.]|nr:hypothetical protein [Ramlibacter sp.]